MQFHRCEVRYHTGETDSEWQTETLIFGRIPVQDEHIVINGEHYKISIVVMLPIEEGLSYSDTPEAMLQARSVFDPFGLQPRPRLRAP